VKILVIQPAFIGDVILATGVLEKLHHTYPAAKIDMLIRKGNEGLLHNHPFLHEPLIWDKTHNKTGNLFRLIRKLRASRYDYVINIHRHLSSGLLTAFSGAKQTIGFDSNPLSFLFSKHVPHEIGNSKHEIERNNQLIREICDDHTAKPRLYPSKADYAAVEKYKPACESGAAFRYITISPASVWFTKQFPKEKWIEWINACHTKSIRIYLLGAGGDYAICDAIKSSCPDVDIEILAGKLNLLESAALISNAAMNYTNDSAPMHLASAMNANTTAIFASTIPAFGFGPLSDHHFIVQTREKLECRPCGLHGFKACPKQHFKCALGILKEDLPVVS